MGRPAGKAEPTAPQGGLTTAAVCPGEAEVISSVVDALGCEFRMRRVLLFGSRAKGEGRPDSDYDFLAVVEPESDWRTRRTRVHLRLSPRYYGLDLVIVTQPQFETACRIPGSVPRQAEREGRVVYERT